MRKTIRNKKQRVLALVLSLWFWLSLKYGQKIVLVKVCWKTRIFVFQNEPTPEFEEDLRQFADYLRAQISTKSLDFPLTGVAFSSLVRGKTQFLFVTDKLLW